jgi:hypothetical protein
VPGDVPGATLRAGLLATLLTCGPTLLSACGPSIEYLPGLLEAPRTPRPRRPETVEILSGDRGGRPYFEIGTLIAGPAAVTSASEKAALLRRLRARAAEVGCDALVVGETVAAAASPGGGGDGRRTIRASCVVFVDDKR